ncbi:hypothetical protein EVAR_74072_1 [Eumeta japonica]|uniref:Uncharacterized protein n=1 Tax=Eumeta variegata TaxID=151549 RepID=A0A4C1TN96_EUMVA|nr:hypothetical protein EVAR_74072_1 [Eumeta japonica]
MYNYTGQIDGAAEEKAIKISKIKISRPARRVETDGAPYKRDSDAVGWFFCAPLAAHPGGAGAPACPRPRALKTRARRQNDN